MTSLFSSFDYSVYYIVPLFYFLTYYTFMFSFYAYGRANMFFFYITSFFSEMFESLGFSENNTKGSFFFYISVFLFIFSLNIRSVAPYNFASTSHLRVVLSLSFIMWVLSVIYNITKNLKGFLSHLVPSGTPFALVSFMVLIEVVRTVIRPLTLTVRLVANVLSGHLLISLLCGIVFSFPYFLFFYVFLTVLEMFVSFIQAYIFRTLLVLYLSDSL